MNAPVQPLVIVVIALLWPALAIAKRVPPAPVPPVVWQGIEYRAPLDVEHMGHVRAFDLASGRKLWETEVYHVSIDPLLEKDVQWVFVSGLQVDDGKLLVRNEHGRAYRLDLKTGRVEGFVRPWLLLFLAGCLLAIVAFFIWVKRGGGEPDGAPNG